MPLQDNIERDRNWKLRKCTGVDTPKMELQNMLCKSTLNQRSPSSSWQDDRPVSRHVRRGGSADGGLAEVRGMLRYSGNCSGCPKPGRRRVLVPGAEPWG